MKKVLISFLAIAIFFSSALFVNTKKISFAINDQIIPIKQGNDLPKYDISDICFTDDNIAFLTKGSGSAEPQILSFDGRIQINNLLEEANFLCYYDNYFFYASTSNVYCYDIKAKTHKKITTDGQFNYIKNLVVSSKNLFLINNINQAKTGIYKYNTENFLFDTKPFYELTHGSSEQIKEFAYSEIAKEAFIYNGRYVKSTESSFEYEADDIAKILCDFEGNLYLFKKSNNEIHEILRFSYETGYANPPDFFELKFQTSTSEFFSAVFNYNTGEFTLLRSYESEDVIINIYKISKEDSQTILRAKTVNDIPNILEFKNIKLSGLNNFYVAKITDYPSNRLYPADINIGGTPVNDSKILEIEIGEKVLVFFESDSGKFSYILYKSKFAVIYNNSLSTEAEKTPEFKEGKVLLNRSNIYSCPSNFAHDKNQEYSFIIDAIEKGAVVEVLGEIELYGTTYCKISYGNNKSGYINKAEISKYYKITTYDPRFGRIDSNKNIPLYKNMDILSEQIIMLSHKQKIEILESDNNFCYIQVDVGDETYYGYVETKYVLEDGLTKLQKIGLWIFVSTVSLAAIAILLRVFLIKRKKLT